MMKKQTASTTVSSRWKMSIPSGYSCWGGAWADMGEGERTGFPQFCLQFWVDPGHRLIRASIPLDSCSPAGQCPISFIFYFIGRGLWTGLQPGLAAPLPPPTPPPPPTRDEGGGD